VLLDNNRPSRVDTEAGLLADDPDFDFIEHGQDDEDLAHRSSKAVAALPLVR